MPVGSEEIIKEWLELKSWKTLYPVQQKATDQGLLEDIKKNFVVIAPTASGKTGVAELAMLQALKARRRVAYLVPMQPLISDKIRDFSYLETKYNYDVIEGTPRLRDWDAANVVVTTFELFYRTALIARSYVEGFGLVIIDEFHILYDRLRGFNLEKVITILKEFGARIICLSATFEDRNEIAEWLDARIIEDDYRGVPLKHDVIDLSNVKPIEQKAALCASVLEKSQQPYLLFCTTRESTKRRALEMCQHIQKESLDKSELTEHFLRILGRQHLTDTEQALCNCLCKQVAFHHSGLDQRLRTFVEELFLKRKVNFLFSTTGLAYGVNLPAKTVVLCDLSFWDPNKRTRVPVPVYMYIQMAGRAGRPQFDKEGYAYLVVKKAEELENVPIYWSGKIEKAVSQIGNDEYFRKTILELIYSGRHTDKQILEFFEKTFYNFQAQKVKTRFIPFNLFDTVAKRVKYLYEAGFIDYLGGAAGYKLTDLGQVTLKFLFGTFAPYELAPFLQLNRYLEEQRKVEFDFSIIYILSCLFDQARLSKIPNQTSSRIEEFFEGHGVTDRSHAEYSAYAVCFGWIENMKLNRIESDFKVYASPLPQIAMELYRLLQVYEALARSKNYAIPPGFRTLKERIRFGVRTDELPFAKLKGIGRETAREIRRYCETVLSTSFKYKGSPLDILKALYKDQGEDKFLEVHVKYVPQVGEVRAKKTLNLLKNRWGFNACIVSTSSS